ncbi:hypothetical protein D3C73_1327660 [compost metagenome]
MLAQAIKKRLSKEENQKGFTLIELLAVIVILGIIAVIAIPLIGNIINNSKEDADKATAKQIADAARLYVVGAEQGDFSDKDEVTLGTIQGANYIDSGLVLPSTKVALDTTNTIVEFSEDGTLVSVTLDPAPKGVTDGKYTAAELNKD